MARFYINQSFKLNLGDKQSYVLAGQVLEGSVRAGMVVRIPFNSSFSMSAPFDRIEFARRGDGVEDVCLCFDCDDDNLDLWEGLNLSEEEVDVLELEPPCEAQHKTRANKS